MRRAAGAFLVVAVVGVVAFLVLAATSTSRHAFSLNAPASAPAVTLKHDQSACQVPIDVPEGGAFDAVRTQLGTFGRPGPALEVSVRDAEDHVLARRTLAAGYADVSQPTVPLGRTFAGRGYRLCFQNRGRHSVAVYGTDGAAVPSSGVEVKGQAVPVDLFLEFERAPRSKLAAVGDVLRRATLFRSPRLSAALYGVVLVLLLVGAAAGLVAALRSAERDD